LERLDRVLGRRGGGAVLELADTSAWTASLRDGTIGDAFNRAVAQGQIATCRAVAVELVRSSRTVSEIEDRREKLNALRDLPIRRREWDRALDVMHALAERDPLSHRRMPLVDLLVAAAAESAEVPVLHYDRHFERIAEITGQPHRALAPIGSL
jgi:predicted nucleic acid-binding protein